MKEEKNIKILLVTKASGKNYSIEAGIVDNERNFDHHGEYEKELSPCINTKIPVITSGAIEITHIDCDTYIGLLRMIAPSRLPKKLDLNLIAEMDKNGTSKVIRAMTENYCKYIEKNILMERSLHYFVGVGKLAKLLNFPRVSTEIQDVTQIIFEMCNTSEEVITEIGKTAIKQSEKAYKDCCKMLSNENENEIVQEGPKVGYWVIGPDDSFDPSRPYIDGIDIVIVFRKHWETISIYCNPESKYGFAGKEIAGILFQGHPKACGSPRGQEMTQEDGERCFNFIMDVVNPR